jgi:hypothetical protein
MLMAKGDNAVLPPCKLVTMLYLNARGLLLSLYRARRVIKATVRIKIQNQHIQRKLTDDFNSEYKRH